MTNPSLAEVRVQLWILRHGQAEPYSGYDAGRALTAAGRLQVEEILRRQGPQIDTQGLEIWTSPFLRARQTANLATEILQSPIVRETDLLVPEANARELLEELYRTSSEKVLLVSHQPLVSLLLDILCGQSGQDHSMTTASLAAVTCEVPAADMGQLQWLAHPR